MPPPLEEMSDDQSSGGSIPYENEDAKKAQDDANHAGNEQGAPDDNEEEDDEDEEGVYVVESIVGHDFLKDGTLLLQVKWKGYDDPADQTMESEENLMEGAKDLVEGYYNVQGGRPQKPSPQKPGPKKRKSVRDAKQSPKTAEPKRQRKTKDASAPEQANNEQNNLNWVPKGKSWENEVEKVDTILREPDSELCAYLHWKNGKKSRVSLEACYDKCPKKMLKFYEKHLRSQRMMAQMDHIHFNPMAIFTPSLLLFAGVDFFGLH